MKKLPYEIDVEKAVLGALLIDNNAWDIVGEKLNTACFALKYHQMIFQAIQHRLVQGQPIDILILEQDLKQTNPYQDGLFSYLVELMQSPPTVANIDSYAEKLRDLFARRELTQLGQTLQQATNTKTPIDTLITQTETQLFQLTSQQPTHSITSLSAAMQSAIQKIERVCQHNNAVSGIPTGIEEVDLMTTGFQPADFVVIAGRPGMGKTAFLLSTIKATLEQNTTLPIQFYSLEMPSEQILLRLMSMISNVSMQTLRNPLLLDNDHFSKLGQAMTYIKTWENRLLLDDASTLTPELLRSRAKRYTRLYGQPAAIFIDYLQLIRCPNTANRYEEISRISNSLKALAKDMQCPVIALAQLNRVVEGRAIKKPTNADLRDSGEIEQDADVILLLHRDDYYQKDKPQTGLADIIIGKQRNGPVGSVTAHFAAQYSRFDSLQ